MLVKITSVTQGVNIKFIPEHILMTLSGMAVAVVPPAPVAASTLPIVVLPAIPQTMRDYNEVRLCGDESTYNEDALLSFMYSKYHGLYVQKYHELHVQ